MAEENINIKAYLNDYANNSLVDGKWYVYSNGLIIAESSNYFEVMRTQAVQEARKYDSFHVAFKAGDHLIKKEFEMFYPK